MRRRRGSQPRIFYSSELNPKWRKKLCGFQKLVSPWRGSFKSLRQGNPNPVVGQGGQLACRGLGLAAAQSGAKELIPLPPRYTAMARMGRLRSASPKLASSEQPRLGPGCLGRGLGSSPRDGYCQHQVGPLTGLLYPTPRLPLARSSFLLPPVLLKHLLWLHSAGCCRVQERAWGSQRTSMRWPPLLVTAVLRLICGTSGLDRQGPGIAP